MVNIKLREGEHVLSVVQISEDDEILLTTERGQLTRIPAHEIRRVGRASLGVRIMNLNAGDRLTGVARIIKLDSDDDTAEEADSNVENSIPGDEHAVIAPESAEEITTPEE